MTRARAKRRYGAPLPPMPDPPPRHSPQPPIMMHRQIAVARQNVDVLIDIYVTAQENPQHYTHATKDAVKQHVDMLAEAVIKGLTGQDTGITYRHLAVGFASDGNPPPKKG